MTRVKFVTSWERVYQAKRGRGGHRIFNGQKLQMVTRKRAQGRRRELTGRGRDPHPNRSLRRVSSSTSLLVFYSFRWPSGLEVNWVCRIRGCQVPFDHGPSGFGTLDCGHRGLEGLGPNRNFWASNATSSTGPLEPGPSPTIPGRVFIPEDAHYEYWPWSTCPSPPPLGNLQLAPRLHTTVILNLTNAS